jgi:hypothetical protein
MPSRRDVLKIAGALAAAPVLHTLAGAAPATAAGPSRSPAAPPPAAPRFGWNIFTFQARERAVVAGVERQRPGAVRWTVEWDRYQSGGDRPVDWSAERPFFAACAAAGTRVVMTMWVANAMWLGDDALDGGLLWAKPGLRRNYPRRIADSYTPFVRDLVAAAADAGLTDLSVGAWNEADLLWGGGLARRTTNYATTWSLLDRPGQAYWTGGTGRRWTLLHRALERSAPTVPWNTSGIASTEPAARRAWVRATAKLPQVTEIDLHSYAWAGTPEGVGDLVDASLAEWDAATTAAGRGVLPFLIGETNTQSSAQFAPRIDTATAALLRASSDRLAAQYPDRYLGMCSLGGEQWTAARGWWEIGYDAAAG